MVARAINMLTRFPRKYIDFLLRIGACSDDASIAGFQEMNKYLKDYDLCVQRC